MSTNKDYENLIAEIMKTQAKKDGLDPSNIDPNNVHVKTTGPTIQIGYGNTSVSLPAPSQSALDQWFTENGKFIAGSLATLLAVVVGAAIARR